MATVIYRAPEDDDKAVTIFGVTLYDGEPVEVDDPAIVAMFKANRFFDVADIEAVAVERRKPGRPPKTVSDETNSEGGE